MNVRVFKYKKSEPDRVTFFFWFLHDLFWGTPLVIFLILFIKLLVSGAELEKLSFAFLGILFTIPFLLTSFHDRLLLKALRKIDTGKEVVINYDTETFDVIVGNNNAVHCTRNDISNVEIWHTYLRKNIFFEKGGFYRVNLLDGTIIIVTKLMLDEFSLLAFTGNNIVERKTFFWYSKVKELK